MTRSLFLLAVCAVAWRGAEAEDALPDRVQIIRQGDRIEIGNRFLARTFVLQPRLATSSVTNRLTGRQFLVQGDEFVLDLGQDRRLTAAEFHLEAAEPDSAGGQLTFLLRHVGSSLRAIVVYQLRPNQSFLRKQIRQGIMEPSRECPEFLRLLTGYTRKELGCGLGLHVYTTGRRSPLLKDWIAARFDMAYAEPGPTGRGAYCLADPRAESLLTANLGRYVREHGVSMYYYDWGCFACPAGQHRGHMPGYGTEAIADAFLRHLQAMRAANREMFLCDTGWFSPWWLEWYDAVFFAGGDWNAQLDGPPAYATVDFLGTWRDRVMKQRLEARPYFPATGYINHGAISHNWMEWRNRAPQPRQAFVNYVAMMFLLGPQIAEYILALPELSEQNRDLVAMTTYPHCSAQKRLFRYGQSLEVKLSPHELQVIEFAPQDSMPRPMTLGCREQLLESGPRRTVIALLDSAGPAVQLVSPAAMEQVLLDGKPCPVAPGSRQATIELSKTAGAVPTVGVGDCSVRDGRTELALRLSADVPSACRATLVLLAHQSQVGSSKLEATIRRAGREVEVESPHLNLRDSRGRSSGTQALAPGWSLFRAPLPAGRAELECLLRLARPNLRATCVGLPPVGPWRGVLQAFIDTEFDLPQTHRLEICHAPLAAAPLPSLPLHWNAVGLKRREVVSARPVTIDLLLEERNLALATGASPPRVEVDSVCRLYTTAPINDGQVFPRGRAGAAWASAESPQEHFVTLTWPEKHRIGKVYVCWGQADWLPRAYRLECRVDGAWIGVDPVPGAEPAWRAAAGRDTVVRFRPVSSDALRIVQQAGGGGLDRPNLMGVAEVAVYE